MRILLWCLAIKITISIPWNLACLLSELNGKRKGA